jgi:DNA-binding transcriptional MerR regulator
MFKIGEFSRLSRVPVKTLRYYDEIGLLKPAQVNPFTDYRQYTLDQLPRLNRILALKDFGLSLEQIADLMREDVSPDQLRGMLRLKRAELQQEISETQARLARVEARIHEIETEQSVPAIDVIVKQTGPLRLASLQAVIQHYSETGDLLNRLINGFGELRLKPDGPLIATYFQLEYRESDIQVEVAVPVNAQFADRGDIKYIERSGDLVATVLHQGSYATIGQGYRALLTFIAANGYEVQGICREVYLRGPELGVKPDDFLTEIQIPIRKISA